jgi:hypothetical protein
VTLIRRYLNFSEKIKPHPYIVRHMHSIQFFFFFVLYPFTLFCLYDISETWNDIVLIKIENEIEAECCYVIRNFIFLFLSSVE